jgi:hypothetical protein
MPTGARDQIIGGGTPTDLPGTIGTLPVYTIGGLNAHISDSVFKQADAGHQVIIGLTATVNAGQVATKPATVIGEGASGWGDGAVAIGKNAIAGQNAAKDGSISIGSSTTDSKNGIRIGSSLAFGTNFDDVIVIGTQASSARPGVCIGKGATQAGVDGVSIGTSANGGEGSSVAIGRGAACTNSGLGTPNKNVAIGDAATCNPSFASSTGGDVAIGAGSSTNAQNAVAIGAGANVTGVNVVNSIALGAGTSVTVSNTLGIGDTTNAPVNRVAVRAAAATAVRHSVGPSGEWMISDTAFATDYFVVDASAVAGDIRMRVYDVTAAALKRVSIGAVDSGGVGFKLLRVPN